MSKFGFEKRKMQNVSFRNINDFLDYLPENEIHIVEKLRNLVLENIPNVSEFLSFNVPFYKVNKNICFIWPSSVVWGKSQSYNGVRFGFSYGNLLNDEINFLSKEHRKQVFWRDFINLSQNELDILKSFIFEATVIDGLKAKKI